MEKLIDIRYPPYAGKLAKFRAMSEMKPDFDRQGKQIKGVKYWLGFVFGLGGKSLTGTLLRWAVLVLVAVGAKKVVDDKGSLPAYLR